MHQSQPVVDTPPLRPLSARHWSVSKTSLSKSIASIIALYGLILGLPSFSNAAENLWLDAARSSITTSELRSHASVLADDMLEGREAGSRGGREAAKYIVNRLKEASLQPGGPEGSYKQSFLHGNQNLLAVLPGSDPDLQGEYIVIGAHYDHVGYGSRRNSYGPWGYIHNGADDNASGVATLLEIIDALSQTGHRPRRSILFAFWDGEENGLLGSKHWINYPTIPKEAVKLAINIDMVGRLTEGRIEVGGTRTAVGMRRLLSSPQLDESTWLDFSWDYKDNSDHWTFFNAGIPAIYFHTGLHDDYHRPSDDVEKLNIDGMRQVSTYVLERLAAMADADHLPALRAAGNSETPAIQRRLERPLPALAPRLDFTWRYVPSEPATIMVQQVPWNSQARQAGITVGDRIVSVNGKPITSEASLPSIALQSNQTVDLEVMRPGTEEPQTVSVSLVGSPTKLGLSWRADPVEPHAVYITRVVPYSPAALSGIELYDRIYALNNQSVSSPEQLLTQVQTLLDAGENSLQLEIESRGAVRQVVVPLGPATAPPADATL